MEITIIKTDNLFHHPNNPRKDYKDIEELTDSVRANGILQPLTVVKLGEHIDRYNVVAGNRRLEAAKAAGLKECPCIVSDMDEKEQASLMLIENMQRKNLNPYEECRGVQMCLDLGMSESDLAKKTGFSKETIKHRRKMAELDQKKLKDICEDRQISIQEFISLEKIKDIDSRNKVLDAIGTNNFGWALQNAISQEKMEADRQKAYDTLISFAEEMPADWADSEYRQCEYNLSGEVEIPEDADETDYAFKLSWSGGKTYSLYKRREDVEEGESPEESDYEINRRKQDEAKAKLRELGETFFKMRKEHMKHVETFDGNILQWLAYVIVGDEFYEDNDKPKGFPWNETVRVYECEELYHETMGSKDDKTSESIVKDVGFDLSKSPIASTTLVYSILETSERISCATWQGGYDDDDQQYSRLYTFMELCGYKISDEEQKIIDGTHEAYYKEEE